MNAQGSKKILFNKSTLLSLKAELLKKREEVGEKKQLPQHKLENFKPVAAKKEVKTDDLERPSFKDKLNKQIDTDELEAHKKAKAALEKKAELYEHLSDGAGSSQLASKFLVDFNTKKRNEILEEKPPSSPDPEDTEELDDGDDSEWVEFTDCLGRTRKCHKSDIDLYKKRDKELMKAVQKDIGVTDDNADQAEVESTASVSEKPPLVQKTNDYLQSLREKWEEKERELQAKDKDVHYQDLLFDEARIHGVSYFSFSTDENERRRQMEEMKQTRDATLKAQQAAEVARSEREKLMAARVAAARARRRLRAGLPPEDPEEKKKEYTEYLLKFLNEQKEEADVKAKEEEKRLKEEKEKERQKIREAYVREWDIGKDGVKETKKFREMTQEEYVEQQRSKRINEFAPLTTERSNTATRHFDNEGRSNDTTPKTWAEVRPEQISVNSIDVDIEPKGLYFTSTNKSKDFKYKNFVKSQESTEPTPIVNELSDDEGPSTSQRNVSKRKNDGVEIAPPPTYDYYGPVSKHARTKKPFDSDMNEAYAQGSKSLQPKPGKRQISEQYDFLS